MCFINVDVVTTAIEKIGKETSERDGLPTGETNFPKVLDQQATTLEHVRMNSLGSTISITLY